MARLRSTRAHEQVLESALELFSERGIDTTSMDAIAAASGVSKATIYKHWADKDSLCLELLDRLHGIHELPVIQSKDVRADIIAVLAHRETEQRSEMKQRMMPHLMAYAARNPAFAIAWRTRVMEPPRDALVKLLKRAVAEGKLSPDIDLDLSVALLSGPMMYRHVLSMINSRTPEDMPERVVATFWKAYGTRAPARTKRSVKTKRKPPIESDTGGPSSRPDSKTRAARNIAFIRTPS